MNLQQLHYLIEVDQHRSITRAADHLYISQSRLSKVVKDIESELHYPIFERTPHGVVPTPKGTAFLNQVRHVLYEYNVLENMSADDRDTTELSISIPRASYLADSILRYIKNCGYPIHLDYKETNSIQTIDSVRNKEINLGVIRCLEEDFYLYQNLLEIHSLHYEVLFDFEFRLLLSRENPCAGMTITRADLREMTEIRHKDIQLRDLPLAKVNTFGGISRNVLNVSERGSQFDILRHLPNAYVWVSPMPSSYLNDYGLIERRCSDQTYRGKDLFICRKGTVLSREEKELLAHIKKDISLLKSVTP